MNVYTVYKFYWIVKSLPTDVQNKLAKLKHVCNVNVEAKANNVEN